MIESAILLPNTRGQWQERIAGMTVLERQMFTLARAGIQKVWLDPDAPTDGSFRTPAELQVLRRQPERQPSEPHLVVSGDVFFRIEAIRAAAGYRDRWALRDESGDVVLRVLNETSSAEQISNLPMDSCISLRRTNPDKILTWLFDGLRKDSDGLMAKYFDRGISLAVTRQVLDTWIRPNHLTIFSTWIGLIGAAQFFYATRHHEIAGAFLIWLHTVLDGCDGEMARLTFRESPSGAWLDFWGDNLVHVMLFAGLAVRVSRTDPWAPLMGVLACIGALGSALGSAWLTAKSQAHERRRQAVSSVMSGVAQLPTDDRGWDGRLKKLEVFLAQRDFIYILVFCSLIDHNGDFLWAAGLGAPLYLLILVYLVYHRKKGAPEIEPYPPVMVPKESI